MRVLFTDPSKAKDERRKQEDSVYVAFETQLIEAVRAWPCCTMLEEFTSGYVLSPLPAVRRASSRSEKRPPRRLPNKHPRRHVRIWVIQEEEY